MMRLESPLLIYAFVSGLSVLVRNSPVGEVEVNTRYVVSETFSEACILIPAESCPASICCGSVEKLKEVSAYITEAKRNRGRKKSRFILIICGLRHHFSRNIGLGTVHPRGENQNETDGNNDDEAEKKFEKISVKILRHTLILPKTFFVAYFTVSRIWSKFESLGTFANPWSSIALALTLSFHISRYISASWP